MAWSRLHPVVLPRALRLLRRELGTPRSLEAWVDFAETFHHRLRGPRRLRRLFSIAPSQIRSEFLQLLETVEASSARRILEIGTANGGSLFLLARAAGPEALLLSVDLPEGPGTSGYPTWKEPFYRAFAGEGQTIRLVRADSQSEEAVDRVRALLDRASVDLLFIDGDHSYGGVARDYASYLPLVRPGGLVAFHDIVPDHRTRHGVNTSSSAGEVYRFWAELKRGETTKEFVQSPDQDGFGIGLLVRPGVPREAGGPTVSPAPPPDRVRG